MKSDKSYCFCAMEGCNNNSRRNSLLRYFKFPRDPIKATLWSEECNLTSKFPAENLCNNYKVCSEHFTSKMFLKNSKAVLRRCAIPKRMLYDKKLEISLDVKEMKCEEIMRLDNATTTIKIKRTTLINTALKIESSSKPVISIITSTENSPICNTTTPLKTFRDEKDESHELVTSTNLNLTPLQRDAQSLVYYIGGFVQIKVLRNLKCYYCVKVVTENKINSHSTSLSKDVLNVCIVVECYLRTYFYNSVTDTFSKTFSCLDTFHKILMFCYRAIEGDVYSFRRLHNSVTCK